MSFHTDPDDRSTLPQFDPDRLTFEPVDPFPPIMGGSRRAARRADGVCPHGVYVLKGSDCLPCWNEAHPHHVPLRELAGRIVYEIPGLEDSYEVVDPRALDLDVLDLVETGPEEPDGRSYDRHTGWAEDGWVPGEEESRDLDSDPHDGEKEAP